MTAMSSFTHQHIQHTVLKKKNQKPNCLMSSCLRLLDLSVTFFFLRSNSIWVGKAHFFPPDVNCRNIPPLYLPNWKDVILEKYIANTFKVHHSKRASV